MKAPCWLVGHRRETEHRFVRRLDGYPIAIYTACRNCNKCLSFTRGRMIPPPFDAKFAAALACEVDVDA